MKPTPVGKIAAIVLAVFTTIINAERGKGIAERPEVRENRVIERLSRELEAPGRLPKGVTGELTTTVTRISTLDVELARLRENEGANGKEIAAKVAERVTVARERDAILARKTNQVALTLRNTEALRTEVDSLTKGSNSSLGNYATQVLSLATKSATFNLAETSKTRAKELGVRAPVTEAEMATFLDATASTAQLTTGSYKVPGGPEVEAFSPFERGLVKAITKYQGDKPGSTTALEGTGRLVESGRADREAALQGLELLLGREAQGRLDFWGQGTAKGAVAKVEKELADLGVKGDAKLLAGLEGKYEGLTDKAAELEALRKKITA